MSSRTRNLPEERKLADCYAELSAPESGPWHIRAFHEVSSTMEVAREALSESEQGSPIAIFAERQTAGRGRLGRVWKSPPQGLMATYAFPVFVSSGDDSRAVRYTDLPAFSLVSAVVIAETLERFGVTVDLKWPNDIFLQSKKIGGILLEFISARIGYQWVLVGCGLNLKGKPDFEGAGSVSDLAGVEIPASRLGAQLGIALRDAFYLFLEKGLAPYRQSWLKRGMYLNSQIEFDTDSEKMAGVFRGIGPGGEILIEQEGVTKSFASGDVIVRWS